MANLYQSYPLLSLQEVPENFRPLFASYPCFNRVQSAVFNDIINSNSSIVITAPTGSGKTVVFELAILKLMMSAQDPQSLKIVYVAPVKALCNERFNDWHPRFKAFNMSVVEVTGDSQDHCDLQDHQIIITTPEKWDSLTRRWRDSVSLVQLVKLVMIDEVHLLSDSKRGPILETIVCRMKTVMRVLKLQNSLRFIAVSATIFNIEDLARWLGTNENDYKFHRFGHEVRPVTLNRVVKGYPQSKSPYLFDIQLSYKLKAILLEYGEGKPSLIFCSTRRGVVQTCKTLMENISFNFTPEQVMVLESIAEKLSDGKLKEYVKVGGAYHHAGMALEDRLAIQNAFFNGVLPVLVATSTLAMGVNLPAHLVVIKSTHQFIAGRVMEYPESSILQMVGRAGRPQFDTTATAVIMTKSDMVHKYQNLLDCKEVIESSLHLQLPEQLNAEIVLLTIFDLSVAMQWIQCTFLYLRALKNPKFYGLSGNANKIEKDLELIVLRAINALQRSQLIEMNENGLDIAPTPYGRLMSHYYINFNTFQLYFQVADLANVYDLIEILSNSNELSEIQLRVNDKKPLNELNVNKKTETIRFKLDGKIKTRELKINCLVQACLGCLAMDPALQQESARIVNVLERIVKCLTEFLTRKNSYCSLLSSVMLSKCLHSKLWENSPYVARQLDRIGATLGATFVACGKTSFNSLIESHPQELERCVNRGPPFGNAIIEQVRHLPMYSLFVQVDRKSVLNFTIHIQISIANCDLISIHNTAGRNHSSILIVGDTNNRLLMYKRVFDENLLNGAFEIAVEVTPPMPQKVFVHVVSEQWVGIDVMKDVLINPMAAIVVGSYCYLPGAKRVVSKKVDETKKTQTAEGKKPVLKVVKAVSKKSQIPKLSNSENFDNYCCFDLVPDWIDNTPDVDQENDFAVKSDFHENYEVPDILSPMQIDADQNDFAEDQNLYKSCFNDINFPDNYNSFGNGTVENTGKSLVTCENFLQEVDQVSKALLDEPAGQFNYEVIPVFEDEVNLISDDISSNHHEISGGFSVPGVCQVEISSTSENITKSNNNFPYSEMSSNRKVLSVPSVSCPVEGYLPLNHSENVKLPTSDIFSDQDNVEQEISAHQPKSANVDCPDSYLSQIGSESFMLPKNGPSPAARPEPPEVCFDLSLPSTPCTIQNEEGSESPLLTTRKPPENLDSAENRRESFEVSSNLTKSSDCFNLSEINDYVQSNNDFGQNRSIVTPNVIGSKPVINPSKVRFTLTMPKLRSKEEVPAETYSKSSNYVLSKNDWNETIAISNSTKDLSVPNLFANQNKFTVQPSTYFVTDLTPTIQTKLRAKEEVSAELYSKSSNYVLPKNNWDETIAISNSTKDLSVPNFIANQNKYSASPRTSFIADLTPTIHTKLRAKEEVSAELHYKSSNYVLPKNNWNEKIVISGSTKDLSVPNSFPHQNKFFVQSSTSFMADITPTIQTQNCSFATESNTKNYATTKRGFDVKSTDDNSFEENLSKPQLKMYNRARANFDFSDQNLKAKNSFPVNQCSSIPSEPALFNKQSIENGALKKKSVTKEIGSDIAKINYRFECSSNMSRNKASSNHFLGNISTNEVEAEINASRHEKTENVVENLANFNLSGFKKSTKMPSNPSNFSFDKLNVNQMPNKQNFEMSVPSLEMSDTSRSWQVTEVKSPLDLTVTKTPNLTATPVKKSQRNLESLLSQILPQETLLNKENIDPLDTTNNWVGVEQSLMSASQKNTKLASFRERFCNTKSKNRPYLSQQIQKPNNLPQETNLVGEKLNMNSVPSLKSLFAAAQAAKKRHFN